MQQFNQQFQLVSELLQQRELAQASVQLKPLLSSAANFSETHVLAAELAMQQQRFPDADQFYRLALQLDSGSVAALEGLIRLADIRMDYFEKTELLELLVRKVPSDLSVWFELGISASFIANMDRAEHALQLCLTNQYTPPWLYLNLGHVYKAKGQVAEASRCYRQEMTQFPAHAAVAFWSLADLKSYRFTPADQQQMQYSLNHLSLTNAEQALIHFAQAKCQEQQQDTQKALEHYQHANSRMKVQRPFKAQAYSALVEQLCRYQPIQQAKTAAEPLIPIFIVGMPRSGTTLTEQILVSHSLVEATDELPDIERLAIRIQHNQSYSAALNKLTEQDIQRLRETYLKTVKRYLSGTPRYFIDKNPNNFLHLGLIKKLFPEAKIINVMRCAAENAMAVYKQFFSRGHDYCYCFDQIHIYWTHYIRLMQHWDQCFASQIYHMKFEQLVMQPESQIRGLLNYLQLNFETNCLTFYNTERTIMTPSSSQVRQPMNIKALEQTRAYRQLLPDEFARFDQLENTVLQSFFVPPD